MSVYCPECGRDNLDKSKYCLECGEPIAPGVPRRKKLLRDRYEILQVVKAGAMGCVYMAKDYRTDEIVAVKKMHTSGLTDEDRKYIEEKFRHEARFLATLHHDGIPKIKDFFEATSIDSPKPALYMVMTFIQGKDLVTIMRDREDAPLSFYSVINLFEQLLKILHYLHSLTPPIVYRDMKASNIMIKYPFKFALSGEDSENQPGKVFLVDFGIARLYYRGSKGTLIGTPGYAAPEQYTGYTEPRSDLYSLGIVMHYLLTGVDPENEQHPTFIHEPVRKINPEVPEDIEILIMSMLELTVEKRPKSALEILSKIKSNKIVIHKAEVISKSLREAELRPKRKYSIDLQDEASMRPIHIAVMEGDYIKTEKLLNSGIQVNVKAQYGWTPLHFAIDRDLIDIARLLIIWGASVKAENSDGKTCLHLAAANGNADVIEQLIEDGADVGCSAKDLTTPLHLAASTGGQDAVVALLEAGADKEAKDTFGNTPLDYAVKMGKIEVVETLLRYEADLNTKDFAGWTPLHHAVLAGKIIIVTLLLDRGADFDEPDREGNTPLDIARTNRRPEIERLLINRGAKKRPVWDTLFRSFDFS
ncbi:MAG: ankyrin repeat domain-containing protein [Firmicutes bacterium]|nr:ankyrin repeat domain-containing protein [Bacillota bacterium]